MTNASYKSKLMSVVIDNRHQLAFYEAFGPPYDITHQLAFDEAFGRPYDITDISSLLMWHLDAPMI